MITIVKPDFEFSDDRGLLVQLVHDGYRQVNMCFSKGGTERGGHFHRLNKETFYIVNGRCELTASLDGKEKKYTFSQGDMFTVNENVLHSIYYPVDTTLIVMYDKGVELPDGTKDIISGE